MLIDKIGMLRTMFASRKAAQPIARRWRAAAAERPQLRDDVVAMAGILTTQPVNVSHGVPEVETPDPYRLAYEAGRRDLGLQLLSLMNLSIFELNSLMEDDDA
ncbi:hypothetical protein [Paenirhodobacter sp. CAU 1674]|uniref:hypothetical protein n=1 Tax=Paenirhodobacter sp. CAU 1674 TaxID=3032596 RepID=UPI0023DCE2F4|nr:hypothetical protein [Paenirhodobacter sp. CAU 1674]MDF2143205.1 hypothetical protein [Paenirhodobacter sp. CAU 1674]